LKFSHVGKLPKEAMGHNVVILKAGVDVDKFAQKAAASPKTEYLHPESAKDIVAKTKLIGGGQKDTIIFTAPSAGSYKARVLDISGV
jgi:azurin